MFEYNFTYNSNEIQVTIDLLGHEQVFLNKEKVSSCRKWTLSNTHSIVIDGIPSIVEVKSVSITSGQIQVSLFQGGKCIESQIQTFDMSNKNISLSDDELRWQAEISIGSNYSILAKILYFGLLCFSLLFKFYPESLLSEFYFLPVIITTVVASYLFVRDGITTLFQKENLGVLEFDRE